MTSKRIDNFGRINRDRVVSFTWNQKKYFGFEGDTLASAMLANDIKVVGRSFKYHRPRGIMSCGVEESGALVTIGEGEKRDPNVRATTQELYEGLIASGQNAFPSVNFDLGAVNGFLGRFFAAGFYYKTFIGLPPFEWGKGTKAWMFYEKIIRRAAGMGTASRFPDPDKYEHANDFCDVMVIGSGPAGIAAAQESADKKLDVILVEQDSVIGGDKLSDANFDNENLRSSLINSGVKIMTRTTAFGLYDNCVAGLLERVTDHIYPKPEYLPRQRFWTIRAKHIILSTGAFERHIAFNNNDIPGVMSANASKHYLNRYGILTGKNITLATNNDSVYDTAIELAKAGSNVSIIDSRSSVGNEIIEELNKNNIELILGRVPYNIKGKK
jgi:NADPH-dependent 2,4-dienoyl-CoA reductase/sulfur reductase-like enzyme